jgi:hypothetical protein
MAITVVDLEQRYWAELVGVGWAKRGLIFLLFHLYLSPCSSLPCRKIDEGAHERTPLLAGKGSYRPSCLHI